MIKLFRRIKQYFFIKKNKKQIELDITYAIFREQNKLTDFNYNDYVKKEMNKSDNLNIDNIKNYKIISADNIEYWFSSQCMR